MMDLPDRNRRRLGAALWLLAGLAGIALAVAIALVATNLVRQPVGLAGEPVSAGRALEPVEPPPGQTAPEKPSVGTTSRPDPDTTPDRGAGSTESEKKDRDQDHGEDDDEHHHDHGHDSDDD